MALVVDLIVGIVDSLLTRMVALELDSVKSDEKLELLLLNREVGSVVNFVALVDDSKLALL